MSRLLQILFGTLLVTFPFSIRFLVYEENAYRFGHFNPWVSEFIYVPEILLLITFGVWVFREGSLGFARDDKRGVRDDNGLLRSVKITKSGCLLFMFILNVLVVTFWKGDITLGLFFSLRILEGVMLYHLVTSDVLSPPKIVQLLLAGAGFQLVLAALQWKLNHSVGLTWLGEPVIGPEVLNVAKVDLADGTKHIRSYGTFLHPNILAAYFVTLFFIAQNYLKRRAKIFWLILMGLGVFLTQSFAAAVVGTVGLLVWILFRIFKNSPFRRVLSLVLFFLLIFANAWLFLNNPKIQTTNPSVKERLEQNVISREVWFANPLGVGARNFTLEMENFSTRKLSPWEFQPVHNTFFLILNETGIQGLILLLILIGWFLYRYALMANVLPFLTLLVFAPFDHFLWDSFAGLMLASLAIGFFSLHNQSN